MKRLPPFECLPASEVQNFKEGDWVSHNGGVIDLESKRQITAVIGYDKDGGVQYRLANAQGIDHGLAYDEELDMWPGDDVALPMKSPRVFPHETQTV